MIRKGWEEGFDLPPHNVDDLIIKYFGAGKRKVVNGSGYYLQFPFSGNANNMGTQLMLIMTLDCQQSKSIKTWPDYLSSLQRSQTAMERIMPSTFSHAYWDAIRTSALARVWTISGPISA